MPAEADAPAERPLRILLQVATRRDAEVTQRLLAEAGLSSHVCGTIEQLAREIQAGAGALVLTEEALAADESGRLLEVLQQQEEWSDLPMVLLMKGGSQSPCAASLLRVLTNVTLLERPASLRAMLSAVQAAVRARCRQYDVRDHMEAVRRAERREQLARRDAERANRLKDEFLATLSHELRTPLNAIAGWIDLMKEAADDPATVEEAIGAIARNVRAQAELIEDLLDVSRIISGKIRLDFRRVRLPEVVAAAVETVAPAAQAKNVKVETVIDPALPPLTADAVRLQQIVWNLLSNAVKFTPPGGHVRVEVKWMGNDARVTVTDDGEGIAPEFLPRIFERFSQADGSPSRRHGGLGLGLSIVQGLTEMHGGRVRADSPGKGRGATFQVELPLSARAAPEIRPPQPATAGDINIADRPDLARLRLLIVDDEPDAREVLRRLFARCGAQPFVAGSAEDASEIVHTIRPHVIISDIGMPGTDGYQLIRQMREQGVDVPAIALTAFARSDDASRAAAAGYDVHLAKPVDPPVLLAHVGRLIAPGAGRPRRQVVEGRG